MNLITLFGVFCYLLVAARADVYLHNPRGSNNRLDEQNRERNNANRMFDSQNNDRGGYNVGNMYYLTGSQLQIEWTNQHSCNAENSHCEIVLQYMCSETLRDGSVTRTIPEDNAQCANNNCDTDYRYGMHENNLYYKTCKLRARNGGLFTADQKLGSSAINTRQNPNGQRYAYECPEERDYYPYWHPTDWKDIAVLTNDVKNCDYYMKESENVKSRWYCLVPLGYTRAIPNNKEDCEKLVYPLINGNKGVWAESTSHNIAPPVCLKAQSTRDNHLGNTQAGSAPVFNWTIPDFPNEKCVVRIRYNISTAEFDGWQTFQNSTIDLSKKMSLAQNDAVNRGYVYKTNPAVKLFSDLDLTHNLAIDTAQFGRVFEDRSFAFEIRQRPAELKQQNIINLNVRGKRGNIVQVYPSVEYDFVPNRVEISRNDYLHIQWTGSNTNNPNNAGQGLAGTDRSNMILLKEREFSKNDTNLYLPLTAYGDYIVNYPAKIPSTANDNNLFLGFSPADLQKLAFLRMNQYGGSLRELNDAGTYFDIGPVKVTKGGVYHYMCTRNNNFSNRDQKGQIIVSENPFSAATFGSSGGELQFKNGRLTIPGDANQDDSTIYVRVESISRDRLLSDSTLTSNHHALHLVNQLGDNVMASDFIAITPNDFAFKSPINVELHSIKSAGSFESTSIYRLSPDYSVMSLVNSEIHGNKVSFDISQGGIYFAKKDKSYSVLIGTLVGIGVLVLIGISITIFLFRNKKYRDRIRYSAWNIKRSAQDSI